jgi:hypothetical protein
VTPCGLVGLLIVVYEGTSASVVRVQVNVEAAGPSGTLLIIIQGITVARQSLVGQGLLIVEVSRSLSHTPHPVGLLCTRDQPDAEAST